MATKKKSKLRTFRTWLNKYYKDRLALMIFDPTYYSRKVADQKTEYLNYINVTLGDCTRQITLEFETGWDHYGDKLDKKENKNNIEKAKMIKDAMERVIEALEEVRDEVDKKTS
jgi:hypothetical protein